MTNGIEPITPEIVEAIDMDDIEADAFPIMFGDLQGYRIVDMARKVVGVGSVGTRTWILLLLGKDDGDPLMLQIKEAAPQVRPPPKPTSTPAAPVRIRCSAAV